MESETVQFFSQLEIETPTIPASSSSSSSSNKDKNNTLPPPLPEHTLSDVILPQLLLFYQNHQISAAEFSAAFILAYTLQRLPKKTAFLGRKTLIPAASKPNSYTKQKKRMKDTMITVFENNTTDDTDFVEGFFPVIDTVDKPDKPNPLFFLKEYYPSAANYTLIEIFQNFTVYKLPQHLHHCIQSLGTKDVCNVLPAWSA
eukprot:TRINITY_DN6444_c0_g1_i1.p1 TRINITY_DN6444_c0_g1~~TRINITY_DN6444_c0_g1_i1.p1  ORF type:complete len:201 (-),score=49.05 TRINITY_DN6444_c0_g1_i1:28-630(-)